MSFPCCTATLFILLTNSLSRNVDVKSGGAARSIGCLSTGLLDRCCCGKSFDRGGNETWVTVFAKTLDVSQGCCSCKGFISSANAGVGDKEGSSEDKDEGVERGVVKVDEGEDGDEQAIGVERNWERGQRQQE